MSNDWYIRQCEIVGKVLGCMLFNRQYEEDMLELDENGNVSGENLLFYTLKKHVKEGDINGAENLLFDEIEKEKSPRYLQTALDFYQMLMELNDARLVSCRFSREEIYDGIAQVMKLYGIEPEDRDAEK